MRMTMTSDDAVMEQITELSKPGRPIRWWHWLHAWSIWGTPYGSGGLTQLFGGGGQLRQQRHCMRCNKTQDRSCAVSV